MQKLPLEENIEKFKIRSLSGKEIEMKVGWGDSTENYCAMYKYYFNF